MPAGKGEHVCLHYIGHPENALDTENDELWEGKQKKNLGL